MMNRRIILTALSLLNAQSILAAEVTRAPYLQLATSDSMQIVWRTDGATAPVVRFGTTMDNLDNSVPLADIFGAYGRRQRCFWLSAVAGERGCVRAIKYSLVRSSCHWAKACGEVFLRYLRQG
ncbi:fibronectin type III domain-containing protein [Rubritalea profundi]|uniref:Glycosyl-hydrolase 97 N-terminal domain-containing protein n=1 Tax=Rubritalea profundi TaxID=1658618 RepID=A0A2S7U408_9BACT|nr:fibronectin type III domain-containing protein [Rubritalea profundi]PQJ29759.1 hypothetical protein BSZ32_15580 [Rubritalea profundi]